MSFTGLMQDSERIKPIALPNLCHPEQSIPPQVECGVKDLYFGTLEKLCGSTQILLVQDDRDREKAVGPASA